MKKRERTFFESLKRFFWLLQFRKLAYSKFFFVAFLRWFNAIIHVLFLENIVKYVEVWNKLGFNNVLKYYLAYIISFELINYILRNWGWVNTEMRWMYDIYKKYLRLYISLDNNSLEKIWTWKLMWIIQVWVRTWSMQLSEAFEYGVRLIISLLFTLYMVARTDFKYALLFLFLLVLFSYFSKLANDKMQVYRRERYEIWNTGLRYLVKIIMSKMDILQSDKIKHELGYLYENSEDETAMNKKMSRARVFLRRSSQFWISLLLLFTFYYLWNDVLEWKISISTLVWLSGALIITQNIIAESVWFYANFTKRFVNIEKMWDLFDNTNKIKWYDRWKKFKHTKWKIEIENLTYWYIKDKPVFKDFNLKLKWEKVTAFVWNSWSWKTTLVKLISGYIRSDSWNIIIDDQKLKNVSLKSYYKDIWYLTQEPSVFDGSIYDNLTYAIKEKVDDKKLNKIIRLAKCEFIYDLVDWRETEIGERWVRLSWGQRQRLAIAKIMLKDPKIIILDEPTSALDSFSEEQITKAMKNLFKWRTVVIIAHRLQTVKHADDIILIENGEIKERGTHKWLVKLKGQYSKMLELQSWF
mgnify:FL=1